MAALASSALYGSSKTSATKLLFCSLLIFEPPYDNQSSLSIVRQGSRTWLTCKGRVQSVTAALPRPTGQRPLHLRVLIYNRHSPLNFCINFHLEAHLVVLAGDSLSLSLLD